MNESLMESGEAAVDSGAPVQAERDFVVSEDSAPDRPEWLPEKYSSGEDLAKAYKSLESKIGTKDADMREAIMGELQEQAYADRPETSGDYELPDSVDPASAVDSDLLSWWSEHAFENGYSQDEFQKGIQMYMESGMSDDGPDLDAETAKLGENSADRITSASLFASKFFPQDSMPAIERMCESAEGIIALEHIAEALKGGSFSGGSAPQGGSSESDLREMMKDDRYHHPVHRDPSFVKQVEAGFRKLYG